MTLNAYDDLMGTLYISDKQARIIFGTSAEWIRRRGRLARLEGDKEVWACYGTEFVIDTQGRASECVYLDEMRSK